MAVGLKCVTTVVVLDDVGLLGRGVRQCGWC